MLLPPILQRTIFSAYNAEGLVLNYAADYYQIRALGYPLTLGHFCPFWSLSRASEYFVGHEMQPHRRFLNVGLDYLLVYGIEGCIPAMHLEGAAYASVIAQVGDACNGAVLFLQKNPFWSWA